MQTAIDGGMTTIETQRPRDMNFSWLLPIHMSEEYSHTELSNIFYRATPSHHPWNPPALRELIGDRIPVDHLKGAVGDLQSTIQYS